MATRKVAGMTVAHRVHKDAGVSVISRAILLAIVGTASLTGCFTEGDAGGDVTEAAIWTAGDQHARVGSSALLESRHYRYDAATRRLAVEARAVGAADVDTSLILTVEQAADFEALLADVHVVTVAPAAERACWSDTGLITASIGARVCTDPAIESCTGTEVFVDAAALAAVYAAGAELLPAIAP